MLDAKIFCFLFGPNIYMLTLLHAMQWSGELDYHLGMSSGSVKQLGWFHDSSSWLQRLSVARG